MVPNIGELIDISMKLGARVPQYPEDPPFFRRMISDFSKGDPCRVSLLSMSSHSGTHIDAPAHFIRDGKTIDQYEPKDFILPAQVVEIKDTSCVRRPELEHLETSPGEALLLRTENSRNRIADSGAFHERFVYLSAEAADWCVERRLAMVGIDYLGVDPYGDERFPAHHKLLAAGILAVEGLDLREALPGRYTLVCVPLSIEGGEAAPARAFLCR
jgi:arylformamidase